jgi:O-antigen/teichoic acid export membrane protein
MVFLDGLRANQDLSIRRGYLTRQVIKAIFAVSAATIVITLSAVLVRQTSSMLVGVQLGADQVALLAFPILIVSAVMPFIGVANRLVSPVASQLDVKQEKEKLYQITIVATRYVLCIGLLLAVLFYYLGFALLDLWLSGPNVDSEALYQMSRALVVLFTGFAIATPGFVVRSVLVAVGKHWPAAFAELWGSLIGISIGILLMIYTHLGVLGMAIGVCIAFIVRGVGFHLFLGAKYYTVDFLLLLRDSLLKPVFVSGCAFLLSWLLFLFMGQGACDWQQRGGAMAFATIVWSIGVWVWIVEPIHKERVILFVKLTTNKIGVR